MKQDFLSLYDESFDDVYRYIYSKTGNKWDSDDIASDVFKRAFEKYSTVSSNPRAWLFVIARNAITDYYRSKKYIPINDNIEIFLRADESLVFNDDYLERKSILMCLKMALSYLSHAEFEIIRLRYFSNLKYREIGEIIGKNEDSIKTKSCRIIKKLRELLNKCLEG